MPIIESLNVWGGQIHDNLTGYLHQVNSGKGADIFCIQEVHDAPETEAEWLTWPEGHGWHGQPVRPNLFSEIARIFPGHRGRFYPSVCGPLVDEDGTSYPTGYGIATLVRRTLPIIGERAEFVAGEYLAEGWGEQPQPRIAHCVRLDTGSSSPLVVAHMHGVLPKGGKGDMPIRTEQADRFATIIESVARPGDRVIACGDWNLLPGSDIFRVLGARFDLSDLVFGRGFTDTRTSHYKGAERHSNYMLVSSNVKVLAFDVPNLDPPISDHKPLVLDIK